jgi:hypothetical protein
MLDHFGPLFVVGSAVALLGWAVVVLTSRIERERQEAHRERFAEPERGPLPQWAKVIRGWLLIKWILPASVCKSRAEWGRTAWATSTELDGELRPLS